MSVDKSLERVQHKSWRCFHLHDFKYFLFFLIDEQNFYKRIMWVAWKLNVEILCNDVYMSAYPIQFLKFL